jgi:alcohol dehydrogenase class IV
MRRAGRALLRAYLDGRDREARQDMALASLLGGLALANAGLGVVHGFAAPVGGMFAAPHGAVCAALLPHAMDVNIRALRTRAPASQSLARYETVARILTGRQNAAAEDGVEWASQICRKLRIPPLSSYGIHEQEAPGLVEKASKASSMKGNPVALTTDELREVLIRALQ